MTRINFKFKTILFYAARVFSVALSLVVVWFLVNFINYDISVDYFVLLLIFSLLFIIPGISIFIKKKLALWFYIVCALLLMVSAFANYTNWTLFIVPIWILVIVSILIYEIRIEKND